MDIVTSYKINTVSRSFSFSESVRVCVCVLFVYLIPFILSVGSFVRSNVLSTLNSIAPTCSHLFGQLIKPLVICISFRRKLNRILENEYSKRPKTHSVILRQQYMAQTCIYNLDTSLCMRVCVFE